MNRFLIRFARALLLLIFLSCAVYGPWTIMSDTHPAWEHRWLQGVVSVVVCLFFLGIALCFSLCCLTGDISRSEERHGRC